MHPLPEYPRPSMRRDSYVNLNGPWDYAITQSSEFPAKWDGAILVPYSPEAKASGVSRTLQPGQWLHYHRTFTPPAGEGGRVLLHFGAVDYACAVEVNGRLAGGHRGGYWPFTLDITDLLRPQGHNTLWVAVQDPTGTGTQARGKQTLRPGGMFYPAQSGIWQTVWLERVPENYIDTLTVTPDYDARTVTVKVHTSKPGGAANLWAVVRAGGVTIAEDWGSDEADRDGEVTLNIAEEHFFPWSPDSPFLYDLTVGTTQGEEEGFDTVHSYFALRKWECKEDAKGIRRFFLNGMPILLNVAVLLDRMSLSIKNGWQDKHGNAYIICTIEEVMDSIHCARQKAVKLLDELEHEFRLIERRRQGLCKPNLLYVKDLYAGLSQSNYWKYENHTSCGMKNELPGVPKSNGSNTEKINKTDNSETDLIYPAELQEEEQYRRYFKEALELEILEQGYPADKAVLYEILELLVETVTSRKKFLRICGEEKPKEVVKSRLMKLDSSHIQYILECLKENSTQIRNIKQYLLATLYNAPVTVDSYYSAQVRHEFGWGSRVDKN